MYNAVHDIYLLSGYWDKDNIESKRKSTLEKEHVGTFTNRVHRAFSMSWETCSRHRDQLFQEVSNYCVLESESRRRRGPHVVETKLNPNQIDRFSRFKQVHE